MAGNQLAQSGVPFVGIGRGPSCATFSLGGDDDPGSVGTGGGGTRRGGGVEADVAGLPTTTVHHAPETTVLTFHRVFSKAVHKSSITQLVTTPTQVVTSSRDKLVKLYSQDLQCLRTFYGHEAEVTCAAFCGESAIVSGSRDCTVRSWRVADGSCENVFEGHTDSVLSVCMSETRCVSCAEDDTIRIWSRSSGRCTQVLRDSTMHVVLHPSSVLITASDGALTAWNLLGHVERLRRIPLADDHEPEDASGSSTRLLALHNDTVICDLGTLVKTIKLPFPSPPSKSKEP
eukprot:m.276454 g.276454  ORF g.276454 m.276454 type:complete len:288 (+) comp16143_c1_seq7:4146-5009(+)